jgi:hemolysin activation/secretion protein
MNHCCFKLSLVTFFLYSVTLGNGLKAIATSPQELTSHLEEIRANIPSGLLMRLPSTIPDISSDYQVQILGDQNSIGFTINLFSCQSLRDECLVGSFGVEFSSNSRGQEALQQHIDAATPITLAENIEAYLLMGIDYSSVMWEQDNMIYKAKFLTAERQKLLYMALSMVNSEPIEHLAYNNTEHEENQAVLPPQCQDYIPNESEQPVSQSDQVEENQSRQLESYKFKIKEIIIPENIILYEEVKQITKTWEGQEVYSRLAPEQENQLGAKTVLDLITEITNLYIAKGYITSKAILSLSEEQDLPSGTVNIEVIEGTIANILVENRQRLSLNYICSRIKLGIGKPLNHNQLEDQLKLLRKDPLFHNVEAKLQATETQEAGKSDLRVIVTESQPFTASLSFDNYSPSSVGSERFGLNLSYNNVTEIGDQITVSYYPTITGGAHLLDFFYKVPINAMNGTILLHFSPTWNRVTEAPFDELDIRAEKKQYEIFYRQPLVRSIREEFALSLGFSYQHGQTFIFDQFPTPFGFGPDDEGNTRTSVISFAQDYVKRDSQGAWGLRSQFNFGVGLFNATSNEYPLPDGYFFSWLGQIQRVQSLSYNHLLIMQADVQLTPNSLLPAHQFVIGGNQSVRGYRENARSGDSGFRFSIEDRITVLRDAKGDVKLQIIPFIDLGSIWNQPSNPNRLYFNNFLISGGIGILYQPIPDLLFRLDYGIPFIALEDKGNNLQDYGLNFSVQYQVNR